MAEPFTLYKLIILYMLSKVDFPLTNSQISDFILERDYTSYFTLQQAFSELEEAGFVSIEVLRNTTQYHLSSSGRETLGFFQDRIPTAIMTEVNEYLGERKLELRNEVAVTADYFKTSSGEYAARCRVKEKESDLIDLTLTVPTQEEADVICRNWKTSCDTIYQYLVNQLMQS